MADAATLIVLVATGEAADATTRAMARATREALGPSAHVIVRETSAEPADSDVAAVERSEAPDAVVELSWIASREGRHRQASVRMHLKTGRWVDRWITFRPTDADAERGRTLGFAIASILPEENGGSAPASPPPSPTPPNAAAATPPASTTPEGSPPTSAAPGPTPPPASSATAPNAAPPASAPPPPAPPAAAPPPSPPHERSLPESVERTSVVTGDIGGIWFWDQAQLTAGGYGAIASAEYFFFPVLAARAGGSLRYGSIGNTSSTAFQNVPFRVWSLFGGLAYQPLRPRMSERWGVSVRASWVVEIEDVRRVSTPSGNSESPPDKVNYGPEIAVDGELLILPDVELVLGIGGEYMLRASMITINGVPFKWRQPRPFGEAGIRIRF